MLTSVGRIDGVAHKVSAEVTPNPPPIGLLLVVPDTTSLDASDTARLTLFGGWNFVVTLISDTESQSAFNAAFPIHRVVYVSASASATNLGSKLTNAPIGVVTEHSFIADELGLGSDGYEYFDDDINLINNGHFITESLSLGSLTITTETQQISAVDGTPPAGAQVLARVSGDSRAALLALEACEGIYPGSLSPARRVVLPWAGAMFDFMKLNSNGRALLKRSTRRAAESPQVTAIDVGLAVTQNIDLPDVGAIDSFNSSAGPYGGVNVGSSAVISTNSTSANMITVTDNATVKGSAYAGVGSDPNAVINVTGSAQITGIISTLTDAIPIPVVTEPAAMPASAGTLTYGSGTTTVSGKVHCDDFNIQGSAIVEIDGDVIILCEGVFNMIGDSQLVILADSSLTLYVKGQVGSDAVHFESNAQFNVNTAKPQLATVYIMSAGEFDMDNSPDVYARIVAPNGELDVNDDTNFYGTFLGRRIVVEQSGQLHHDLGISPYPNEVAAAAAAAPVPPTTYSILWIEDL